MKKISQKEEIIQNALGTLPRWIIRFKVKLSSNRRHWGSCAWNINFQCYYQTIGNIKAVGEKSARKKAIKILKRYCGSNRVKFRTMIIKRTNY